ncbi:hypothetical protein [Streptomyces halobius]|uniref:Uncharacterized protein n=1 Tax=Streptomyces halobius TaxID=2879846 RepID=A0ABY4M4S7_9ACTN|nr:hypothetical protein [Streptomyces halobius]UQA91241.1 hypothetical protein K9S39_04525 [Streptomyces halobius]
MPWTGSRRSRVTPRGEPYEATQFVFDTFDFQDPEGSLYRVVQRLDPAEFEIATLVPTGWITLLTLHKEADGVAGQDEAMNRWLDIQNLPPTSSSDWVAEPRTEA